jgi:hypothetical protein
MPPVVNFLIAVGSFITAGAAVGATAAVIGTVVVASAVFAASRLMGKIDMGVVDTDRARQTTVRSTIEPRKLVYGETMISGVVSFAQVNGANNKNLHQVIAIAGHKLTSIDKIFFDDYSINLSSQVDGNGDVTSGKFAKKTNEDGTLETMVHIETRDGSASQTAYSDLVTAFAGTGLNAGKGYESTHRGDGVASIYTRWTIHEGSAETWDEVGGIQNIKAVVKGKAVYDPRLDVAAGNDAGDNPTTAAYIKYSDGATTATHQRDLQGQNPALMLADYLMDSSFGLGIPASKIDWDAVVTAADACDYLVPIPTSQTQKRFFGSGVIFGSDNHRKSISKILSGMNGDLIYSQGKYIIKAGIHEASSLAFTEDDLAGDFTVKTSIPRADRFNTIKGMFIDPDSNYKMTEFSPRTVSGAVARDNGEVLEEEVKLTFTSDRYVAQRIAIKKVNQSFLQTTLSLPVNLKGMKVAVGDRITLALNDFATIDADWNPSKEFKVIGWSFSESGNGAIDLSLIEDDSARYADPAEGEYNQISNTGVITSSLADVPLPTNFTATAGYNSVNLAWTNPTNIGAWEQIWIYASDTTTPPATPIEKFRGTAFTHQIAGGTAKYYWIQAVKYPLGSTPASGSANTSKSALVPFGSPTAVTALKIANAVMADDSINTAQIISDAVGSDQIATTLQSDNFSVPNQTGWQISKNGDTTFNNTVVRGNISASTGSIGGTTITSTNLNQYSGSGDASHGDADTDFWLDSSGNFSLKDKFVWTGGTTNTLVIDGSGTFSGAITATSLEIAAGATLEASSAFTRTPFVSFTSTGETAFSPAVNGSLVTWTQVTGTYSWNHKLISDKAFKNGAFVSFRVKSGEATDTRYMLGLADVNTGNGFAQIDYAIYIRGTSGDILVYESGSNAGTLKSTLNVGDVCTVVYDDEKIKYIINGVVERTVDLSSSPITDGLYAHIAIDDGANNGTHTIEDFQFGSISDLALGVTIEDGGITMSSGGSIKSSGKDSESDATAGFFLGWNAAANSGDGSYTFGVGDGSQNLQYADGALSVTGAITATSLTLSGITIPKTDLETGVQTSLGAADSALQDADTNVNLGLNDGSVGGITINSASLTSGTHTTYASTDQGFFLGSDGSMSFADGTNQTLTIDTSGNLSVSGEINASSGAFTGDVSTDSKFVAGSGGTSATMDGGDQDYRIYAGGTTPDSSPFKVDSTGLVTATRLVITRPNDLSAVIFDSNRDGLVGIGLSSISQDTGIVVQAPAVELTSQTNTVSVVLTGSQTLTLETILALPTAKKNAGNYTTDQYPASITATMQYSTNSGSSWSTFGAAVVLTRTATTSPSDNSKFGVATQPVDGNGQTGYRRDVHAIDNINNIHFIKSVSGFAAGSYLFRVQLSFVAGSSPDTDYEPNITGNRTLQFGTDGAGFTVDEYGVITDSPSGTATIGYVQQNYVALDNGNTITVGSGETNTFEDESSNEILVVSDTEVVARNLFRATWNGAQPTSTKIIRVTNAAGNAERFSVTEAGDMSAATASIGGGYGSTGLSIAFDGNLSTDGSVVIGGDLTVNGTTTTVDTDNLTVKDNNITLNYATGDSSSTANDAGITIQDAVSSTTDASILWKTASDSFLFSHKIRSPQVEIDGQTLNDSHDLDSLNDGFYKWGSSKPTNAPKTYMVMYQMTDPNQKIQIAWGTSGSGELYVRRADSGTFYTWAEMLTTASATSTYLPLAGGELTGGLTIDVDNVSSGALRIEANQTNPNNDFYFAQEIVSTLSGTTATTGDREQGGIYMNIDSSATGGDTSHEHRAFGIYIDLDSTGDADLTAGIYASANATPTTGTTTSVMGGYFIGEDNGGAGSTTNVYGIHSLAISDNADSDVNNLYGGFFKAYNVVDSGNINSAFGLLGEIEVASGSGDIYGTSYVVRAEYDNNSGVAQTNTTYLFYGNYAGVLPTTAYGLYINDAVPSYFGGGSLTGINVITTTGRIKISQPSGVTTNELIIMKADDVNADQIWADDTGSLRLRSHGGDFLLFTGGDALSESAVNAVNSFTVSAAGNATFNGTVNIIGDGDDLIINSDDQELVLIGNRGSTGTNLDAGYLRMKAQGVSKVILDTEGDSSLLGGGLTVGGNLTFGDELDISMAGLVVGQAIIKGNSYTGGIALDSNAMHIYHNSSSRDLILGTNESARVVIAGNGSSTTFNTNINLPALGTADTNNRVYNSRSIVLTANGWDTNNEVGRNVEWTVKVEPIASIYPDADLKFYEPNGTFAPVVFHGRGSTGYADPQAASFFGNVSLSAGTGTGAGGGELTTSGRIVAYADVRSQYAGNSKVISESQGDFFPSLEVIRSSGTDKTDYHWLFQLGSFGFLNIKDNTNNYYPIILKDNGDVALSNDTAGANPVLLLDNSANSATFDGDVVVSGVLKMGANEVIDTGRNITSGTIDSGVLNVSTTNVAQAVNIYHNDTDPLTSRNALRIDYNVSGNTALTTDITKRGIFVDMDVTGTGGNTLDELRAYGISADVRGTGDTDIRYAIYGYSETEHSSGTVTVNAAIYGLAVSDDTGTGHTSNNYGGQFLAYGYGSGTGGTTNFYGSYSKAQLTASNDKDTASATGVYAEVELSNPGQAQTLTNAWVVRAEFDNNSAENVTINNAYLFYGNYAGTLPSNTYGVYIPDAIRNYFGGYITTGLGSTTLASYGFNGDLNTGMYSPANHQVGILVNGTQRLEVNGTGIEVNGSINMPMSGQITFYGNGNNDHSIASRGVAGTATDDIRISSYGSIVFDLDSNSNNTSNADFIIGRHGGGTSQIATLLTVSGEDGTITHSNFALDTYVDGTVPITLGKLIIKAGGKTGWAVGDELGSIDFYVADGSGIGARNAARIVAVNDDGNGTSTTTHSGELNFYTSPYNGNLNSTAALVLQKNNDAVFAGDITTSGNVTAYSDERLKDNIKTLDGSKVLQMRGVSFTKDGREGSGVIAQELEQIASELVITAKDEMGTKSVAYGNLVGYLIENAKQQQAEIDDLKDLVKKLMEK